MRLSESIGKGAMETFHGGLVNRFKIKKRRVTLFFGSIFMNYLKECEKSGFRDKTFFLGRKWMVLYFGILVPSVMKRLPLPLLNMVMKKVWINLGLMEDFNIEKKDNIVTIKTMHEAISRSVGENGFSVGLYAGILNVLYGKDVNIVGVEQTAGSNTYVFRITEREYQGFTGKSKEEYNRLNALAQTEGLTLKDAFKARIFTLDKENRIYFRGSPLYPVENTLFHIIGNEAVLLEKVQEISHAFFREIVASEATDEKKLLLLKTLFQAMGWGIMKIVMKEHEIEIEIANPPFGLQSENDNWEFLARTILGYLWLLDRKFKLKGSHESNRHLKIVYSR